ncbi:hypothetical protein NEOLEDRAFT_1040196, partial [Neolentinus lepideus HHB14362 ss-1]
FDTLIPSNLAPSPRFIATLSWHEKIDVYRVCILCYLLTIKGKKIVPRDFQLSGTLATIQGQDNIIYSGCGSGKTLFLILPLLWKPKTVSMVISPLK